MHTQCINSLTPSHFSRLPHHRNLSLLPLQVLSGPALMTRYDVTPIRWFLSQLRADSMMMFWSSRRHQEVSTSKEPYYGARYTAGWREGGALYSTKKTRAEHSSAVLLWDKVEPRCRDQPHQPNLRVTETATQGSSCYHDSCCHLYNITFGNICASAWVHWHAGVTRVVNTHSAPSALSPAFTYSPHLITHILLVGL